MAKEDGMIEFKKKESQEKEKSVKAAVEELEKKHKPISVASVSAVAAVSRSFIYNHEQLRDMINEKRTQPLKSIKNPSKKEKTLVETLYEINHNLSVENEKLKRENSNLKKNSYKEKYELQKLSRRVSSIIYFVYRDGKARKYENSSKNWRHSQ